MCTNVSHRRPVVRESHGHEEPGNTDGTGPEGVSSHGVSEHETGSDLPEKSDPKDLEIQVKKST